MMRAAKAKNPLWLAPVAGLWAAALISVSPVQAASSSVRFAGELAGLVTDSGGKPQMGAMVLLFNRQDRLLQQAKTDPQGNFSFAELLPDSYSIRVNLSNYLPAMRDRIQIQPGMRSLLEINLSRIFSSIQVISTTPAPGGLMSDDWKWTLRVDNSTRPILRILPVQRTDAPEGKRSAIFSGSRGMLKVSASDGAQISAGAGEADLGTQFAFATSVYGGNHVYLSGNLGYAPASGAPAAGIRTTFIRDLGDASPEVSVTMRQLYLPSRVGLTLTGSPAAEGSMPALRTLAISFGDKTRITDRLSLQYGFELDSVSFLDRLHYFSPYAKLTYQVGNGAADFTWTSGNARPELGMSVADANADLQRDLTALAMLPRVSLSHGRPEVQRGDNYELGVSQRFGSREYRVSGYRERVTNATLALASAEGDLFPGDLLPDLFSNSAVFNAGTFSTLGYTTSVTQDLGENYRLTLMYGSVGVLAPRSTQIAGESADDLRSIIVASHRPAVTLRTSGTVRETGTRFICSYQWTDYHFATPGHLYSTQPTRPDPGLNLYVRQPIPPIPGFPRMEASAEMRNLLAQGYLPLDLVGGRQLLLVQTPRSFRGGLAFVF